jgi:hypothetical protein
MAFHRNALQGKGRPQGGGHRSGYRMSEHDRPPFFGSWRKAYAFAIALFAVEVALLYAFTLRFS